MIGRVLEIFAAVAAFVGGVVLLTLESAGSGSYSLTGHTVFEGLAHGAGLYVIARSYFMIRSTGYADESLDELRQIVRALHGQTASQWRAESDDVDTRPGE